MIAAVATGGPAGAAARARASLEPGSPWVALGHFVEGATAHLEGRRDAAREALEEGVRTGAVVAPWAQALCLAQLGLLAAEDDDWAEAAARGYRARSLLQSARLTGYPVVALVAAVSAAAGAHRGQTQAAEEDAETADRLLAGLGTFAPWYVAETQVWLARARLRLADVAAAHEGLEDARRSVRDAGSPPSLVGWLEAAERRARAFADGASPALTPAELRVLRHLPSHRSFREIGEQLFVSPNTVKTQALAIYRKLGAASRSEAVARAQALDLLDAPTHPERNA